MFIKKFSLFKKTLSVFFYKPTLKKELVPKQITLPYPRLGSASVDED